MNLAKLSISRPIFISCIVILMMILGFTSFKKMGVDLFPDVTFPIVSIQTIYPGAAPNDVEELVSKPMEDEIGSLSGLKNLYSNNLDSVSVVVVEFNLGVDLKSAEQQIRDRIGNLRSKLPAEIHDPVIRRLDPSDQPIVRFAVQSSVENTALFTIVQDNVKAIFERIDGVGNVDIIGGRKKEIKVYVDKNKLQDREMSLGQIAGRIGGTSKNVPVGKVINATNETTMRTIGDFKDIDQLKKVNVNFIGSDHAVMLGDLARVEAGAEEEKTRSFLNAVPAMFVDVYKQSGANTVKVSEKVIQSLERVNEALASKKIDAKISLVRDGAKAIRINVEDVKESILLGIALCVVVVFIFLGSFRSTIITGLALPNSLLGAFLLMYAMGFTINIMTLLALSLAVGLLVDDAIVVRENIFRRMELGEDPKVAAEKGTNEVALAVIATTLVVIAVFGPIAFLDGIVGQFFKQFGLTIVFAVTISLFDALTVAPMLSSAWATAEVHNKTKGIIGRALGAFDRFQTRIEDFYEKVLKFTLRNPKTVFAISFLIFLSSLALTIWIPKTFIPPADNGEFEVRLELPPGASLDQSLALAKELDKELKAYPSIDFTALVIGSKDGEANKSSFYVALKSGKNRKETTTQVKNHFRDLFQKYSDRAIVNVQDYDFVGGGMRPVTVNFSSEDLESLSEYVEKVKTRMKDIPGLVDVDTNYRSGKPEFQIQFDRQKAEELGVGTVMAGGELRARVEGLVAGTYREKGKEYDIRVMLDEKDRDLREQFNSTFVPNVNFNMIPLSRIATQKSSKGFSQINRLNKGRYIQISGDIGKGGALGTIIDQTRKILATELPPPPGVTWGFVGQAQDFQDLMANMAFAILMGCIFIYLVLSSLYESFIIPFTILLALPMAIVGALIALYITQAGINLFSLIGIVMLLGVATKNSILLVDYTLKLTDEENLPRNEALLRACKTRLRPILMTSFALISGTIPVAVGLNEASKQRTSMGIAIIGGLISSTVLTLIIVPASYGYVDRFRLWVRKKFARKDSPLATGAAK